MKVAGVDPSIAGTAAVVGRGDSIDVSFEARHFPSKSRGKDVRSRNSRYLDTISKVIAFIGHDSPDVICIEGYSFSSVNKGTDIAEFGGLLRADLCVYDSAVIYEVAPSTLKKFVTGKGNADKTAVISAAINRWGVGFATNDEFDAYGLARIAACIAGMAAPETIKQAECLKTVTGQDFDVGKASPMNCYLFNGVTCYGNKDQTPK